MKPIPYGRQHINDDDIKAVIDTLQSDFLTQGPAVPAFEDAFAQYVGSRYAVAVANGTAALHLSALALNVSPGDKVITTPITFSASSNCVRYCGGEIIFADIDPVTYLLDVDAVEELVSSSPPGTYSGIIPVDFTGYPVDIEKFKNLADKYDLWLLEDACHAPGASFTDTGGTRQKSGNGVYADLAIFSFHPVKHIASGEGGMITTNDKELYEKLMMLRTHGITKDASLLRENHGGWYHEMQMLGYNYRLTDIQAALGLSQLQRADQGLKRRQEIAQKYDEAFKDIKLTTPFVADSIYHAYHLYVVLCDDRKGLYDHLRSHQIYAQVHYIPTHLMPYYKQFGWKKGDFPKAEAYYDKCLSLPMFPTLTDEEQEFVIATVRDFISNK